MPFYAGLRLSLERNDANIDLLFITTIRPAGIIRGKYFSAMALTLLIFSACMPFMVLTYLLGGVDLPTIFLLLAISYAVCAVANALGICTGAVSGSWLFRCLAAGGVAICLCYLGSGVIAAIMGLLMRGRWLDMGARRRGRVLGSPWHPGVSGGRRHRPALRPLGGPVEPKLSNRMLIPRLYLVSSWLVTGGMAAAWSWFNGDIWPVGSWMIGGGIVWIITAVAAMSEREAWTTPRSPHHPPQSALAGRRIPAFHGVGRRTDLVHADVHGDHRGGQSRSHFTQPVLRGKRQVFES